MKPEDIKPGMVMVSHSRNTRYHIVTVVPRQCYFNSERTGERIFTSWDDKVVCNPNNFYWEGEKEQLFDKLYLTLKDGRTTN